MAAFDLSAGTLILAQPGAEVQTIDLAARYQSDGRKVGALVDVVLALVDA